MNKILKVKIMAEHNDFGKLAEDLAVSFLENKGYQIITRNFRYQKAEIDIIAKVENLIVIVEVKARKSDAFISPQEAVNKNKIRLIISATDYYLQENDELSEVRFDIITITKNGKEFNIQHIENAFEMIDF